MSIPLLSDTCLILNKKAIPFSDVIFTFKKQNPSSFQGLGAILTFLIANISTLIKGHEDTVKFPGAFKQAHPNRV